MFYKSHEIFHQELLNFVQQEQKDELKIFIANEILNQPNTVDFTVETGLRSGGSFTPHETLKCFSSKLAAQQFYNRFYNEAEKLRKELESSGILSDIIIGEYIQFIEYRLNQYYGFNSENKDDFDIFWGIMRDGSDYPILCDTECEITYSEVLFQDTCLWFIAHFHLLDLNAFAEYHNMSRRF